MRSLCPPELGKLLLQVHIFLVVRDIEDDWYSTRDLVDVFRIYDDLPPEQLGTAQAGGRIKDKFKMQVYDGILTTVSQAYGERWNWRSRHTLVETFKLPVDGELLDTPWIRCRR